MDYEQILTELIASILSAEDVLAQQQMTYKDFPLADQIKLQREHALRSCLEAALSCVRNNDTVARQNVRMATASIDGWYELGKQFRKKIR